MVEMRHRVNRKICAIVESMPVLIQIPENPNCDAVDGLVFQCRSGSRTVTHVLSERGGAPEWCLVTGLEDGFVPTPATACLVEDSGDGMCYLVVGGEWGLRLRRPGSNETWDPAAAGQWGETYLLLGGDGKDLRFA
jgi:hypothetical protein